MSIPRVVLPPLPSPVDQLWHVLMDLSSALTSSWAIVGGQMVLLHAIEHGQHPPQLSQDGDVIADVRATREAIGQVVSALTASGFTVAGMSPDGLAHRYERLAHPRPVVVDVLAPEGCRGARRC